MPLLKDLSCSIELSDTHKALQELGTIYGDGFVETFIPVPKRQQTFTVHLTGRNFIAPGIAMYVFIDGVYQCNRNRQDLKFRRPLDRRSLVDFRVRQKEEVQMDGSMIAREWTFEKLDHASADGAPESCSPRLLENLGCIEVVVLRCAGPRSPKSAANMNMDGPADYPDYRDSRSRATAFDDRGPFVSATSKIRSASPALQYRFPYAETVRSRRSSNKNRSWYSEPVSPGTRPHRDIPASGFQYGSRPIPSQPRTETYKGIADEAAPGRVSQHTPAVDPEMLEKIVADAVKRGVEESKKSEKPDEESRLDSGRYQDVETSSQVPGAWPMSPAPASKYKPSRSGRGFDRGSDRDNHTSRWDRGQKHRRRDRSRATRVGWDEEPEWDKQARNHGRESPDEETWSSDETWSKARGSTSRGRIGEPLSRQTPGRPRKSERSQRSRRSRKPRPKSRTYWVDETKTSSSSNDGWTHAGPRSSTSTSSVNSNSTVQPSHSRSQTQRHQRRLSQLTAPFPAHQQHEPVYHAAAPSVLVTNAPSVATGWQPGNAGLGLHVAPAPTWGCASTARREGKATITPPAAFSAVGASDVARRVSSGSSTWGADVSSWDEGEGWGDQTDGQKGSVKSSGRWSGGKEKKKKEKEKEKVSGWRNREREKEKKKDNHAAGTTDAREQSSTLKPPPPHPQAAHPHSHPPLPDRYFLAPTPTPTPAATPAATPAVTPAQPTPKPPSSSNHPRVLAGPGTPYGHAVQRPAYVDSLEKPYAVFRFRYGGEEVLRGVFGAGCVEGVGEVKENGRRATEEWLEGVEGRW